MSSDNQGRWELSNLLPRLLAHHTERLAAGRHNLPISPPFARTVPVSRTHNPPPRPTAVDVVTTAAPDGASLVAGLRQSVEELSGEVLLLERRLEAERMAHQSGVRGFHLVTLACSFLLIAAGAAFLTDQVAAGASLVPPSVAVVGLICGAWLGVATGAVIWATPRADG